MLGLICVAGCEASVCEGICFAEARVTAWGISPGVMRWVDVDADGAADLVVVSPEQGTVSVVWGADAALGGVATTWSVAREVAGLAVVDVNRDGLVDLVTAVPQDDEVAVLRGRGGREFAAATRRPAGKEPRVVIAVELDAEEGAELVTVNFGDGTVSVLGDEVRSTLVGSQPRDVAGGDLDGDGDVDLAVALAGDAAVQVLLGDGAGGLIAGERFSVGAAPHAVAIADFDGDAKLDVATADTLGNTVSVVLGSGERREWPVDAEPRSLAVVDRAGEAPGLAVLSEETDVVTLLEPATGERVTGAPGARVTGIAVGDIDGEAGSEVVYASEGSLGVLKRDADGIRIEELWSGGLGGPDAFGVDVDGDGLGEAVVVHWERPAAGGEINFAKLEVLRADAEAQVVTLPISDEVNFLVAEDFTGDGLPDMFVASWKKTVFVVQQADGGWEVGESENGCTALTVLESKDFGRVPVIGQPDGVLLALLGQQDGEVVGLYAETVPVPPRWIWRIEGRWVIGSTVEIWAGDSTVGWELLGAAPADSEMDALVVDDFDDDGTLDAVMCAYEGMFAATLGGEEVTAWTDLAQDDCDELVAEDLDGDGRPEVLSRRKVEETVVVTPWFLRDGEWSAGASQAARAQGASRFARVDEDGPVSLVTIGEHQPATLWSVTPGAGLRELPLQRFETTDVRTGDVNGDGALDVVGFGPGMAVGFGDGDLGFLPFRETSREGLFPEIEKLTGGVTVDVDGDGRDEVVVAGYRLDGEGAELRVVAVDDAGILTTGQTEKFSGHSLGLETGDFDGDGAADVVVLDPVAHTLTVLRVADGILVREDPVSASLSTDRFEVGDVDGDGHLDVFGEEGEEGVAVYRGMGDGRLVPQSERRWGNTYSSGADWVLGDVDRDRRMDAVSSGALRTVLWPGGGTPRVVLDSTVGALALVDLNLDGQLELLAAGFETLYLGRGDGGLQFAFWEVSIGISAPQELVTEDFDGDGRPDVALVSAYNHSVAVLRQEP